MFSPSRCVALAECYFLTTAFTLASEALCTAGVGGNSPYNVSQVGGYLNYTIPKGTAPAVPLLNSTVPSTPTVPFTSGAACVVRPGWEALKVFGLVIGTVLML